MHLKDFFTKLESRDTPVQKIRAYKHLMDGIKRYYVNLNDYGLTSITMEFKLIAEMKDLSEESREIAAMLSRLTTLFVNTIINLEEYKGAPIPNASELVSKIEDKIYEKILQDAIEETGFDRIEAASLLGLSGVRHPKQHGEQGLLQ
jgi:adenine C2-methylase RlmN of 23S rRNA A2503 and tRNA A37